MADRTTGWSTGVWLLLCAGLAAIIAFELSSGVSLAPQVTAAPPAAPLPEFAPEPAPFEPPPRSALGEIAARPLFSESRRPFVPEAGPQEELAEAPQQRLALELVGTLLTPDGRAALLKPEGEKARWLRVGDEIAGRRIEAIERDQVILLGDEAVETVEIRADPAVAVQVTKPAQERRRARRAARAEKREQPEPDPDAPEQEKTQ